MEQDISLELIYERLVGMDQRTEKRFDGMQADINILKSDVATLKSDMAMVKDAIERIDARSGKIDYMMAGFYKEQNWMTMEIDDMRGRLNALDGRFDTRTDRPNA